MGVAVLSSHWDIVAESRTSKVVQKKADIDHTQQPTVGWSSGSVHDVVGVFLDGAVASLGGILMLQPWFTLPVFNAVGTENIMDLLGDFTLSSITDQLVHSTTLPNLVFQGVDELTVSLHAIDICNQRLGANKELSTLRSVVNGSNIRKDSICSNRFVSTSDISSRESGFKMLPHAVGSYDLTCETRGLLQSLLNDVFWCPAELWAQFGDVRNLG